MSDWHRRNETTTTMRAAVCTAAGGPEVLEIRELPVPAVREGWSLVRVRAAGLNRSELRTRQGHSPSVTFPRVLGIECVGTVAVSTDPRVPEGTTVAAVMGEMGRAFDGGYAEYALLPNALLMPITTTLPWEILAALPETYVTAQGSLDALGVTPDVKSRLLIRGGTSSVGLAAASIASGAGIEIAATTRRADRLGALAAAGVGHPLVDDGESLAASVRAVWPEGPDHVLDLVGARTVLDSLRLVRPGGTVCVSGSLSGWAIPEFEPIAMIPSGVGLTAFHSDTLAGAAGAPVLQRIVREIESGAYRPAIDRTFALDDVAAAHRYMEDNEATGKLVVVP
ncbi:NADPH:quinone reductase-like Zn-dependent oxidoreductase [Nocardia transvalensis]|uniref:NADPH:quinone reductase-like Zn-dependent oxidoreductase n=1 Tax=Nocardia transvalensis TaxID=37333 RepID=A0A7W9PK76_9NOCA|nr:zinc-binding dehydrogenase [Nocardia transvalensis]MBB5917556.1 NADPH:quinone reductase-like Zn-dependent oxidoreductase [Nocardia transvalensis]